MTAKNVKIYRFLHSDLKNLKITCTNILFQNRAASEYRFETLNMSKNDLQAYCIFFVTSSHCNVFFQNHEFGHICIFRIIFMQELQIKFIKKKLIASLQVSCEVAREPEVYILFLLPEASRWPPRAAASFFIYLNSQINISALIIWTGLK